MPPSHPYYTNIRHILNTTFTRHLYYCRFPGTILISSEEGETEGEMRYTSHYDTVGFLFGCLIVLVAAADQRTCTCICVHVHTCAFTCII